MESKADIIREARAEDEVATDIDVAIESAVTTFAWRWAHGPRQQRNFVEREVAQYWYELGKRDGALVAIEEQHEDMTNMIAGREL